MVNLPLGRGAWERQYGREPLIRLVNRFFEESPANRKEGTSLLGRPGTTQLVAIGSGPIRATFTQDGTFSGALFAVSGDELYQIDKNMTVTPINGTILGDGTPSMAGTDTYLFIADGIGLYFLDADGSRATGTLTVGANPGNTETVTVNGVVYTFKNTMTTAFDVKIGATAEESLDNLADAINADPAVEGVAYYVGTTQNPYVLAYVPNATTLVVVARTGGAGGNAYTLAETLASGSWSGATMTGGAADSLSGIATPDDVGIVSLCVLGGYVFLAAAQSDRIYFIRPGAVVIEPLDFFTAEAIPDEVTSLMTVGDQFWAFGSQSTQPFALTGDADAPASPIQGRGFSHGSLEGTAVLLDDKVVLVGDDDTVYAYAGGPERVSNNGIEELVRRARKIEREAP